MTRFRFIFLISLFCCCILYGEEGNLVPDGGFEEVREVMISSEQYFFTALESGVEMTKEGPFVIIPSNFSQFAGTKKLKVIEGEPGKEVHTGKRAILVDGSFYLQAESSAETGDVFLARFYAKGKGKVRVILHLTNKEGKYFGQAVPSPVSVDSDGWVLIEQRLETSDNMNLAKVWPRIEASGDVYIDDIVLVKEPRELNR